ncbi:hypothetical protein EDD17DRAFT_577014 [Pisolithus thermaeus]|nr:hypothetical protein EDD17DRAFT_577014 [Pisolithus thermaeus]
MDMRGEVTYPLCFLPAQAPALRNLKLLDFILTPAFSTAAAVTTLELMLGRHLGQPTIQFPAVIPTQSLTILSLTGYTTGWTFLPDSIHLPLLDALILAINETQPVMKAIVAPKLAHFGFATGPHRGHLISFGTGSKFNHVQTFNCIDTTYQKIDGDALCQELCGVRHIGIHPNSINVLFTPRIQLSCSESAPADHCKSLECITIFGLDFRSEQFDPLVRWLTKRRELGWPRLSVRLSNLPSGPVDGATLLDLYDKLRTCSTLEVDYVELRSTVNRSTPDSVLQLDLLGVESVVADDTFLDSFQGSVQRIGCLPGCFRFYMSGTP